MVFPWKKQKSIEKHLRSPVHQVSGLALSIALLLLPSPPGLRRGKYRNDSLDLGLGFYRKRHVQHGMVWGGREEWECHLIHNQITRHFFVPECDAKESKNKMCFLWVVQTAWEWRDIGSANNALTITCWIWVLVRPFIRLVFLINYSVALTAVNKPMLQIWTLDLWKKMACIPT